MPARGQARESAGRQRSANGELAVRLKQKVLSDRDLPWGGYGQGELAQAGAHRVYQDPAKLTRHIDDLGVRFRVQERLEITDSECRPQCAQTVLDTADIVIALGKLGRGGTEDETVKLLEGIQRV